MNTELEPSLPSLIEHARVRLAELLQEAETDKVQQLMKRVGPDLPDRPTYRNPLMGLPKLFEHIVDNVPRLLNGDQTVLEVGPGVGCFMLVARALGNAVIGIELPPETSPTLTAYNVITSHWGLHVYQRSLATLGGGSFDLIHFRGSIDSVLLPQRARLDSAVADLLLLCWTMLQPGGEIWIGHNHGVMLEPIVAAIRSACRSRDFLTLTVNEADVTKLTRAT